jgi:hypothetical protein
MTIRSLTSGADFRDLVEEGGVIVRAISNIVTHSAIDIAIHSVIDTIVITSACDKRPRCAPAFPRDGIRHAITSFRSSNPPSPKTAHVRKAEAEEHGQDQKLQHILEKESHGLLRNLNLQTEISVEVILNSNPDDVCDGTKIQNYIVKYIS